eukprot:jgi/Botrbrau1/3898/Bobra.0183s0119.1
MAFSGGDYVVPEQIRQFVVYFYRHIRERNIREIFSMYEVSFATLSERFYKTSPWPSVDAIADYVDQDHVFCLLYKEMYFRHLYATVQPSLEQRCDSWDNYCALFNVILAVQCQHGAAERLAVGHGGRVHLPVSELPAVQRQVGEQDGRRTGNASQVRPRLERALCLQLSARQWWITPALSETSPPQGALSASLTRRGMSSIAATCCG